MILSFQTHSTGLDHQAQMPVVPMPETLPTLAQHLAHMPGGRAKEWTIRRPIDMRHCEGPVFVAAGPQTVAAQHVWFTAVAPLPIDHLIHAAVLAYASDYTILEATLRRHGLYWADSRLRGASLDHAMWFHRELRADEWVLYSESSPSGSGGRGLGIGHMFQRDGVLIATVAQEGMLRVKAV